MTAALLGLIGVLVGLLAGYLTRLTEFRREQRSVTYSEFISAFITAAHTGAALLSVGIQQGDSFFDQANRDESKLLWESFGRDANTFDEAAARLRLVASHPVREDSEVLERFVFDNIQAVHPLRRGVYGGLAPSQIDAEAIRLAREFADRSRKDITAWRQLRKPRPALS